MWPNSAKASPVHSTSAMVSMAITAPPAGPDLQISTKRTIYERRDQCREPASADRHRDDGGTCRRHAALVTHADEHHSNGSAREHLRHPAAHAGQRCHERAVAFRATARSEEHTSELQSLMRN